MADSTAVLNALPRDLVDRFEREGWMLVRNYNDEIGASYAEAFGTADRGAVEQLLPGQRDRVRVAARRRAAHPAAALRDRPPPGHRAPLLVQPDRVPQRVDHGAGGARVPGGHLRRRRAAVQHPVRERRPDRPGDRAAAQQRVRGAHRARAVAARRPVLVDNIRSAHAREPYEGPREVLVGMTDPVNIADCAPTVEGGR